MCSLSMKILYEHKPLADQSFTSVDVLTAALVQSLHAICVVVQRDDELYAMHVE